MTTAINDQFPVGLRVLVVDDDVTCLKILDHMLQRCRYRVTTCCKATVALSLLRERRNGFDIVISDVHMPDMNGFKLLELVGLEMDLPVIMMSADAGTNTVMRGIKHGACDYLIKPVRIEELKNIWQHVIRRKRNESRELVCSVSTNNSYRNKQIADDVEYASSPNDGADGSWKSYNNKRDAKEDEDDCELDHEDPSSSKKPRVVWSVELHQQFVGAVNQLGIEKAVPKRILELMNVPGLTRENVASHLQHDDMNMQKFRLYLKRVSGIAQHQNGLPSSLCMPQEPNMKISSERRLDFQALAASGQISPQTLAAIHTEFSGPTSGSLAFPSIGLPVLQGSRQGPKCISTEQEITVGQPLCKFQSSIPKKICPTGIADENAFSGISLWPSKHLGAIDSMKNHGVAINTPNDNMMPVLHQKQSYQLPSESHHVNVQPSCLVIPSVSSNCLPMTQNSTVVPSQSPTLFWSENSSIDINPSSSFDSGSRAVEYDIPSSLSNNGPLCVGKTSDGDILNVTMLNGSPGSIASSVSSCSVRTDSNSGWQLHNSNMNVNPANGLPVKLSNLCTGDSEQKLGRQSGQRQMKNLGFVGKGTSISSRFAVDDVESPTNEQSIENTFIHDDGERAKQQLHSDYMDNFQVASFSSSNFMGVLSNDGLNGSLLKS